MADVRATRRVRLRGKSGLHLRPAAALARLAQGFPCAIAVRYNGRKANAKSTLDLILLVAAEGAELTLEADGPGSGDALEVLENALVAAEPW